MDILTIIDKIQNMDTFMIIIIGFLCMLSPFIIIITIGLLGSLLGKLRGQLKLNKEIRKVKINNPYIYFRDIPSDYGIGVYAFLLDFKISKRDLKAAIIDLSAKGYLKIKSNSNVFEAEILKKDTNDLLENEKYILNWIKEGKEKQKEELEKFDIEGWKNIIIKDILNLGLGEKRENAKNINQDNRLEIRNRICLISFILSIIGCYIYMFFSKTGYPLEVTHNIFGSIMAFILWILTNSPLPLIISIIVFIIMFIISSLFCTFFYTNKDEYYFKTHNMIKYTPETIETLQKVYSLGAFIKDFSNFADRNIDQIVIWERYFSYAYLFKLNNKLKSKFIKVYENNYFIIDENIDKVETITVITPNINKQEII